MNHDVTSSHKASQKVTFRELWLVSSNFEVGKLFQCDMIRPKCRTIYHFTCPKGCPTKGEHQYHNSWPSDLGESPCLWIHRDYVILAEVGVSINNGTPKWMAYKGKPVIKTDDLGVPLFLDTPK